jgi:1,2-diacylglycerol 3-beta-glucosyltransferase
MSMMDLLLTLLGLPVLACALYLAFLALIAKVGLESTKVIGPRVDVVVPAHNEERGIARTVESLRSMNYPPALFRVIVVADNCTDQTARVAEAAGAKVLRRQDDNRRGKGYALAFAFQQSIEDRFAEVVVVVDADTTVSANLLSAFASRFVAGARVLQAQYGVRNPDHSWRTRMLTIALAAFHGVRSLARERLGLSCGLRGNGMGFTMAVLRDHPPNAFSIVEDLEYGIQLGHAGIRVEYVHDALVAGDMPVSEDASRSQRRRWERGRRELIRAHVLPLVVQAFSRRDLRLLDLALDLIVPPIAQLVLLSTIGLGLTFAASMVFPLRLAPLVWGAACAGIVIHVLRGWRLSGVGPAGLLDLLWAPLYIVWKLTLRFRDHGKAPQEWVRTTREVRS